MVLCVYCAAAYHVFGIYFISDRIELRLQLFPLERVRAAGGIYRIHNFVETIYAPVFWNAFKNNFVVVQVPLALVFAIILNAHWLKGSAAYRAIFFLPVVSTTAVVGLVMRFIFGAYKGFKGK